MAEVSKSIKIDHLCRVEGFGGITVEIEDGKAKTVNLDIFEGSRFFEAITRGRRYDELTQIVSRVCAICSGVHTLTSLMAIEDAFDVKVSEQTTLLRDLLLQGGNIESHALHLFCLAVPDFLGYTGAIQMAADHPEKVKMGLELKKLGNTIQELIGGRAVHPVNAVVGGFGRVPTEEELRDLRAKLEEGLKKAMAAIDIMASLDIEDFSESPTVYCALKPQNGDFSLYGDKIEFSTGEKFELNEYRKATNEYVVPHSHAKHSQFRDNPFFVGALARVVLNGNKLKGKAREAMEKLGLDKSTENVLHNNSSQAIELVWSIEHSIELIDTLLKNGLKEEKPVAVTPKAATGTGAIEAPRGILYHSYTFDEEGRVTEADIITPTAQNCANVEKDFNASIDRLKEQPKEVLAAKLEMVARAYDPCISCSVHLVEVK